MVVIQIGCIHHNDVVLLMLACKNYHTWCQPLCTHLQKIHCKSIETFDVWQLNGIPWVTVHTSIGPPTLLHKPKAIRVYIDTPDMNALQAICQWLSTVRPMCVTFLTFNKKTCNKCLTDDMLVQACRHAWMVRNIFCSAITDQAIAQLEQCRAISIGLTPHITSAAFIPLAQGNLKYVLFTNDNHSDSYTLLKWLRHKKLHGVLQIMIM